MFNHLEIMYTKKLYKLWIWQSTKCIIWYILATGVSIIPIFGGLLGLCCSKWEEWGISPTVAVEGFNHVGGRPGLSKTKDK